MNKEEVLKTIEELKAQFHKSKPDLMEKIVFNTRMNSITRYVQASSVAAPIVKEETTTAPIVADVEAPVTVDALSLSQQAQVAAQSGQLSEGHSLWKRLKQILSETIRGADKTIISISTPARPNEKVFNSFNKTEGILLLVFSTNTDAYVVVQDDKAVVSTSAARYWKSAYSVANPKAPQNPL